MLIFIIFIKNSLCFDVSKIGHIRRVILEQAPFFEILRVASVRRSFSRNSVFQRCEESRTGAYSRMTDEERRAVKNLGGYLV